MASGSLQNSAEQAVLLSKGALLLEHSGNLCVEGRLVTFLKVDKVNFKSTYILLSSLTKPLNKHSLFFFRNSPFG